MICVRLSSRGAVLTRIRSLSIAIVLVMAACTGRQNVQCEQDSNCDLSGGGVCTVVTATNNRWCAYPDPQCQSGYRFSDFDVGDGVSGQCVSSSADAGVDGPKECNDRIAFVRSDGLYVIRPDGTGLQSVATGSKENDPVWSPDGSRIAFTRGDANSSDIWAVNADGTGLANLTQGSEVADYGPVWSPDGTRIVFVSHRAVATQADLWIMNSDGSNARKLDEKSSEPTWSPDGTKIAYASYKMNSRFQIYVANADGTNSRNISNSSYGDSSPLWSPDGSKIVFVGVRPNSPQIYVMNADGSDQQALAPSFQTTTGAVWSRDGRRIAFGASPNAYADVYRINADRTDLVNLTETPMADDDRATWSPDGSQLAIVTSRDSDQNVNQEIYRINVDGTGPLRLTMTTLFNESKPAWSPCR